MNAIRQLALLALLASPGCSSTSAPPPPAVGAQIQDRLGRPAVGEALLDPFTTSTAHQMAAQAVLGEGDRAKWSAFAPVLAKNLAVWDAADGQCGNQLLAGDKPAAGRYGALAALLADDRLYVDTRATTCARYLALETGAAGDCGGRTPAMDVVDTTLSLVITGKLDGTSDGIPADPDGPASLTEFPFLRDPAN